MRAVASKLHGLCDQILEYSMKTIELPNHGLQLAYDDLGNGFPVVLLHAFPFDREMWVPQHGLLTVQGIRILAPDLPGFGQSTEGNAPLSIEGVADVIAAFLTELNIDRVVMCGLSMGGYVAMAFARKYPSMVAALILADTRAGPDDEAARAGRDKSIEAVKRDGAANFATSMLPKLLSEHSRNTMPRLVEFAEMIATRQKESSIIAALQALRERTDAAPGLAEITVPTLVIVGEFDVVTPPLTAARLAAHVKGSELIHIPEAGHLSNIENPDVFNAGVLKFLKKVM